MRHKHYETIVAWAEGKEVQYGYGTDWLDWTEDECPAFLESMRWRIKPEPRPDVVREVFVNGDTYISYPTTITNLRLTFDGETGKLKKAEVIG